MRLSRKWLSEFVDVNVGDRDYSETMTMSGSKVEAIHLPGSEIKNVIVGKILSISPHPNADKLAVCQVDTGKNVIQVVTAAKNMKEGDLIPVALDGAVLADGKEIHSGSLRGEVSQGMFCSVAELGLTLHEVPYAVEDGLLILQEDCSPGDDIHPVLGLDDHVIEFEITNNRPDCMNVIGLARETSAVYNVPMRTHTPQVKAQGPNIADLLNVRVEAPDLCPRYTARMVVDVHIGPSPRWIRDRLSASGVRPINNIVDITNYVMLEYGQPMHAFDFSCVEGDTIVVRRAGADATFTTLDGIERRLGENMLVIADENRAVGVAGVMGGENSEITDSTTAIVFESANFNGTSVRTTALSLAMRTDASSRFEKGLDPSMTVNAVDRACELVELLGAGTVCAGMIDVDNSDKTPVTLRLEPERINGLLGTDISFEDMVRMLAKLGFTVDGDLVTVPSWRSDVEHMADLAEEVARLYGYDNLPVTSFNGSAASGGYTRRQAMKNTAGAVCRALGYTEILTYSFISPSAYDMLRLPEDDKRRSYLEILNPLGKDTSSMRTSSLPSMLDTLQLNVSHRNKAVKLYEFATVYHPDGKGGAEEPVILTLGCYGGNTDFYTIKGDTESILSQFGIEGAEYEADASDPSYHPGRCARISCGEVRLGTVGQIHPLVCGNWDISVPVYTAELDLEAVFRCSNTEKTYTPLPKYPPVARDLALVCRDSVTVAALTRCIKAAGEPFLKEVDFFDVYKGTGIADGFKSVAFSLLFRSDEGSLRDEEVNACIDSILKEVSDKFGAVLR